MCSTENAKSQLLKTHSIWWLNSIFLIIMTSEIVWSVCVTCEDRWHAALRINALNALNHHVNTHRDLSITQYSVLLSSTVILWIKVKHYSQHYTSLALVHTFKPFQYSDSINAMISINASHVWDAAVQRLAFFRQKLAEECNVLLELPADCSQTLRYQENARVSDEHDE